MNQTSDRVIIVNKDVLDSLPLIYRALANVLRREGFLIIDESSRRDEGIH